MVKRSGNKKVRSAIKKDIATNPEDAHLTNVDYDGSTSKVLNGNDYDSTRKRNKKDHQLYNGSDGSIMALEPEDTQQSDNKADD